MKTHTTIRIVHDEVPGGMVINLKDFDAEVHEPFDDAEAAKVGLEAIEDDEDVAGDEGAAGAAGAPAKPATKTAKKAAARKRGK